MSTPRALGVDDDEVVGGGGGLIKKLSKILQLCLSQKTMLHVQSTLQLQFQDSRTFYPDVKNDWIIRGPAPRTIGAGDNEVVDGGGLKSNLLSPKTLFF